MKNILGIDSTLDYCRVIVRHNNVDFITEENASVGQSTILIDIIDKTLKKANILIKDINRVVVAVGPGSFTGIRVGISCAKAIGLSLNVPVFGVSNLESLFNSYKKPFKNLLCLIDTKRDDYYSCYNNPKIITIFNDSNLKDIAPDTTIIGNITGNFIKILNGFTYETMLFNMSVMLDILDENKHSSVSPIYLREPEISTPKNIIK